MSRTISPPLRFLLAPLSETTQQPPLLPVKLLTNAVLIRHDVPLLVLVRGRGLAPRGRRLRPRHAARRTGPALHAAPLAAARQLGVGLRREHLPAQLVLAVAELVILPAVGQRRSHGNGSVVLRQGRDRRRVEVFGLRRRVHVLDGQSVEVFKLVPPGRT